ncbi:hypothetical protein GCM10025777_18280 [Membranihabitans marinus]
MLHKTLYILLILGLGLFDGNSQSPDNFKGVIQFADVEDLIESSSDTLLINFWATWCAPCIEELPRIDSFAMNHPDVKIVLISLDFENQLASKLIPFMESTELSHDVYLLSDPDVNTWIPKVAEQWSGAIPASLVLTRGERFFYEGLFTTIEEIENFTKTGKI